jgi:hypothetical protein
MTAYYFWGTLSSALFLSAIPAIAHQLLIVWRRRRLRGAGLLQEPATLSISLNQVFASYCAVYAFFLFGLVSQTPDPFLTIPRAMAGALLALLLFELARDRGTWPTKAACSATLLSLCMPVMMIASGNRTSSALQSTATLVICLTTAYLAHGNISQFLTLRRSRARGAVSLPMHVILYGKDIAGLMFGLQLGVAAWSIVLMHGVNLVLRAPIIFEYLRIRPQQPQEAAGTTNTSDQ